LPVSTTAESYSSTESPASLISAGATLSAAVETHDSGETARAATTVYFLPRHWPLPPGETISLAVISIQPRLGFS
jgi:hypothetical protein